MKSLRTFSGAILLVSHDRHLVQCVIEGAPLIPASELVDSDSEGSAGDEEEEENVKTGTVYRVGPRGQVRALPGGVNDVCLFPYLLIQSDCD
jgi:ATP-binding cassette, subfamily F, member 3